MPLVFTNTNEVQSNGVKVLLYGPPGSGKTTALSTVPNIIILSAEDGLLSIAGTNIRVILVKTVEDLNEAYTWLVQHMDQYDSVGIDSISEIGEIVLSALKGQYKDARLAYTDLADQVLKALRKFRDLKGKNVIMIAKAANLKEELTGLVKYFPTLPGTKLANALPYQYDEVLYLDVKTDLASGNTWRVIQAHPDHQVTAKDRSGKLNKFESPDLGQLILKCKGGVNNNG